MDIKTLQLKELEIFKAFDEVCKKIDVKYTLACGTALGAIRHGGFIPWDDDIDVAMRREDYEKFLKLAPQYFDSKYFVQTHQTDAQYYNIFAKVRDNTTTFIEKPVANIDMHHGVFIDIFPIDKVSNNAFKRSLDNKVLTILYLLRMMYHKEIFDDYPIKAYEMLSKLVNPISRLIGLKNIFKLEEKYRQKYNHKDCTLTYADNGQMTPPIILKEKDLMNYDIFNAYQTIKFEDSEALIIDDIKKYLEITYGDYMQLPPIDKRIAHHEFFAYDLNKSYREL